MSAPVSNLIVGTRAYRAGVERGWHRADRMFSFDGAAMLPTLADVMEGAPLGVDSDAEINDYLDGYAVGFARRVSGLWPNGLVKERNDGG